MKFFKALIKLFLTLLLFACVGLILYKAGIPKNSLAFAVLGKPIEISLVGTGSMYPTLYWDNKQGGPESKEEAAQENPHRVTPKLYLALRLKYKDLEFEKPKIGFGDLVSFTKNDEHFIKRVIGLPGDEIELIDGYVIRNGHKLKEAYTNKDRSTFGNEGFLECKKTTIPKDMYFVLGDNRKLSLDSRSELGFIAKSEIGFILPFDKQADLKTKYRFSGVEEDKTLKPTLVASDFVTKANELRLKEGLKPLKLNELLNKSAYLRGDYIITNNNFLSRDQKGNKLFLKEMERSGYSNVLAAEDVIQGYLDSDELLELRLEFKELKELIFSKDYEDIGVATVNKNLNGCPTQIIVLHFGGFIPPVYNKATLESWESAYKSALENSQRWKGLQGNDFYNELDLKELITLFEEAVEISKGVLDKIINLEWLTPQDELKIKRYETLISEINKLSEKINNSAKEKTNTLKQDNYLACLDNWELFVKNKEDCKKYLK
ncbi:MAG: signal peptidase I [Patescibacteria group bacterium]|mgnify:CR=1 FL=1